MQMPLEEVRNDGLYFWHCNPFNLFVYSLYGHTSAPAEKKYWMQ